MGCRFGLAHSTSFQKYSLPIAAIRSMRSLVVLLLTLVTGTSFAFSATVPSASKRPNVIFILIDDLGWNDVGYNGSTFYETPCIDALSQKWMRFDRCYTPSPMCSPTRVSIVTGKNPARHGVTQWLNGSDKHFGRQGELPTVYCPLPQSSSISRDETTVAEVLKAVGYDTAFMGKWHMGRFDVSGGPAAHGYDNQRAVIEENRCSMFYPFRDPSYFPDAKQGDNFTDLLTDAAIEFLTQQREQPYYLHLCHFAMHSPIGSKQDLRARFQQKSDALPVLSEDRKLDPYGHKPQKLRQDDAEYAGELATLDQNIGRLIDAVRAAGQYDDTIIVITGDNGGRSSYFMKHPTSMQPLRTGKTFLFEGGIRTPLLIHSPRHHTVGKSNSTPVTSMDFFPTILQLVGLPLMPSQHVDGVSLVPLLHGEAISRDSLYWHFPHYQGEGSYPASAILVGDYKLIRNYHHGDTLLFNLADDPYEANNLAHAMPDKVESLSDRLTAYLAEVGSTLPSPIDEQRTE